MNKKWPGLGKYWKDRLLVKRRFQPYTTSFLDHTLYVHDQASFRLGYKELFRDETYRFKAKTEHPYIIDCGSNIGMSIIYFKTIYPQAGVAGFEADPAIFAYLEKNMASFKYNDVALFNKAVWDADDETLSFLTEGGAGGRIEETPAQGNLVEVKTARLRDFLTRDIDFLKIDIEGAEYRVLKDCADRLGTVDHLFIEYHSMERDPQTLHLILEIASGAGFRYHVKEAYTTPYPFMERKLNQGMDLQLNIFCYR